MLLRGGAWFSNGLKPLQSETRSLFGFRFPFAVKQGVSILRELISETPGVRLDIETGRSKGGFASVSRELEKARLGQRAGDSTKWFRPQFRKKQEVQISPHTLAYEYSNSRPLINLLLAFWEQRTVRSFLPSAWKSVQGNRAYDPGGFLVGWGGQIDCINHFSPIDRTKKSLAQTEAAA